MYYSKETRYSSPAIIFVLRHETKRFLPAERSHNRRELASSFLRALAVDDYFKKASSDYARLIGWDDNCEVNWFLMMGPRRLLPRSRAYLPYMLHLLLFFFFLISIYASSLVSYFLVSWSSCVIIIQFRLRNPAMCDTTTTVFLCYSVPAGKID